MPQHPAVYALLVQAQRQADEVLEELEKAVERQTAVPTEKDLLAALEPAIKKAADAGDAAELRRIAEEAKQIIAEERAAREKALGDAQDYFDAALKEYGSESEEVSRSAKEVENWKKSLVGYDGYMLQNEKYFEDLIAGTHIKSSMEQSPAELLAAAREARAAAEKEYREKVARIMNTGADTGKAQQIDALKKSIGAL